MVSHLFFYQLVLVALVWLCVMLHVLWPSDPATCPTILPPPLPKRNREPKPFAGLTTKPHCDACEHATAPRPPAPSAPPPRIVPTRGRPHQVDTSRHFCPYPDCAYQGWVGLGNLCANGHPSSGDGKQPREEARAGDVRPHGSLRERHQGLEGRWEAMRAL